LDSLDGQQPALDGLRNSLSVFRVGGETMMPERMTKDTTLSGAARPAHRFITLDMLRGVAAIGVISIHIVRFLGRNFFVHGYLAVDFFFALSGFVMMSAYQRKLDAGWPAPSFLKLRYVRLYPLYLIGLLSGFSYAIVRWRLGRAETTTADMGLFFALNLLLLPALITPWGDPGGLYPFNGPTWSLFYELIANVLHALFLRCRSKRFLLGLTFVSGLVLGWIVWRTGDMRLGFDRSQMAVGFARVAFSYSAGLWLFRVHQDRAKPLRWSSNASVVLILILLWTPVPAAYSTRYDFLAVTFAFPLLILLSASSEPAPRWRKNYEMLGNASYAIYVLHVPLSDWFEQIWLILFKHRIQQDAPAGGLLFMVLLFGLALVLDKYYDLPVRTRLRRQLDVKQAGPGQSVLSARTSTPEDS
jgi:peptidoglycan/LPS O-acetylase OafA/YrhL